MLSRGARPTNSKIARPRTAGARQRTEGARMRGTGATLRIPGAQRITTVRRRRETGAGLRATPDSANQQLPLNGSHPLTQSPPPRLIELHSSSSYITLHTKAYYVSMGQCNNSQLLAGPGPVTVCPSYHKTSLVISEVDPC